MIERMVGQQATGPTNARGVPTLIDMTEDTGTHQVNHLGQACTCPVS